MSVRAEDRDVLRFLWTDNVSSGSPRIRVLRFTRRVSSSPFLFNATLQYRLDQHAASHPELIARLNESIYVDDVISGAQSDQSYQLYANSKDVLKKGGFNIQKFITNSGELQQKINKTEASDFMKASEETYTKATLGTAQTVQLGEHKILEV